VVEKANVEHVSRLYHKRICPIGDRTGPGNRLFSKADDPEVGISRQAMPE